MRLNQIVDVTLRDGAMGVGFIYDMAQSQAFLRTIASAGLLHAEVGFIEGPAGTTAEGSAGVNFHVGADQLACLQSAAPGVALHRMFDGGNQRLADPSSYGCAEHSGLIRITVGVNPTPRETAAVARWSASGLPISINLKHSGNATPSECAEAARRARDDGATVFYIVDTAGMMRPDDVAARVNAVRASVPELTIGFHGHDNLGLAVANSLIADRSGCALIDASLGGVGAGGGNTPLESLMLLVDPEDDAGSFLRLRPVYTAMGGHVSPALGERAFWGRIGCDNATRRHLTEAATAQFGVETLAWEWRFGTSLSRNAHAEVRRFRQLDGTPFVRKYALSDPERLRAEVAFTQLATSAGLPVPRVLASDLAGELPSYDQPYYSGGTLRAAIVAREYDVDWTVERGRVLAAALRRIWSAWPATIGARAFADDAWLARPKVRLAEFGEPPTSTMGADEGPVMLLRRLVSAPIVTLGDRAIPGWDILLTRVQAAMDALVAPNAAMVPIHGDPHFGNVLLAEPDTPLLIDCVGFKHGGDRAYDIGKILVSLGLHDAAVEGDLMRMHCQLRSSGQIDIAEFGRYRDAGVGEARAAIAQAIESNVLQPIWEENRAVDPMLEARSRIAAALHLVSLSPTLSQDHSFVSPLLFVEGLRLLDASLAGLPVAN